VNRAYNALITKIWPSKVNILSMSTRAVTSIAYFGIHGYAEKYDCDENSIASNRMQNITTMSQNTTDSSTDCENAQLKIYKMPIKVYRLTRCPACHVMFESSFHASILLSFLFIFSCMLNCLKSVKNY